MIQWCTLRVLGGTHLAASRDFYTRVLGMRERELTGSKYEGFIYDFADRPSSAGLRLVTSAQEGESILHPYSSSRQDLYWKIGLGLADVNVAAAAINDFQSPSATTVKEGAQFEDVCFVSHMADPQGFIIELLQTTFESSSSKRAEEALACGVDRASVLGQRRQPVIGQVTLRIQNPEKSLAFYQELGMVLVSVQTVGNYNFTLYFLAPPKYEDVQDGVAAPPVAEGIGSTRPHLLAVENREWCWQLPFTTLELQHRHSTSEVPPQPPLDTAGFESITLAVSETVLAEKFGGATTGQLRDPDGTLVELVPL